jgi:putative spermidine/putrescine transport system substrate-binding protein
MRAVGPMLRRVKLTRRSATKLILGAASSVFAPALARSADKSVYLLTWGGTIQAMLERDNWAKKFSDATGYEVILVPKATGTEIMAAAIAQKSKPQVDVVPCPGLVPYAAQRPA